MTLACSRLGATCVAALVALAMACTHQVKMQFFEVTPVRLVPALAGKTRADMEGTSCNRICSSKHDHDRVDSCVIATYAVEAGLLCTVRHARDGQRETDHPIAIPEHLDRASLPARGAVPIEFCKAAGCETAFDIGSTTDVITACELYGEHPDEVDPQLVCLFKLERSATTM